MAGNRAGKGNPASHRMTNPRRKERRKESWLRGEKRKEENKRENEQRAAANRRRRELGLPKPHEEQRAKRREARDVLRAAGLLPPIGTTRKAWEAEKKGRNAA